MLTSTPSTHAQLTLKWMHRHPLFGWGFRDQISAVTSELEALFQREGDRLGVCVWLGLELLDLELKAFLLAPFTTCYGDHMEPTEDRDAFCFWLACHAMDTARIGQSASPPACLNSSYVIGAPGKRSASNNSKPKKREL